MDYADRALKCQNCGKPFVFSADEQRFFEQKGYRNDPKRCKACQLERNGAKKRPHLAETTVNCAECGRKTTVPFVPRGTRPVLCSECFQREKKKVAGGPRLVHSAEGKNRTGTRIGDDEHKGPKLVRDSLS